MDTLRIAVNGVSYTEGEMYKPDADPFSGPVTNLAPWNFVVLATLMFIVTSLSLFENFTVMLATYKFKQLRQPLNYIIVNLSLADFLVSLTGGVISFVTNAKGYFFLGKWACVLEGFAVTYFGIVAMWSLAVLSFERFFVICRPLGNIRLRGKHAALGLLFVWTFSFIWTIPPVFGWCSYTPSKIGTTCEPNWYSDNISNHTYIITFFITCFIMPLGVIVYSYGKLLQKLRKVSHGRLGNAKKPDRQVTRMVVVMIVAYLVGWTPYAALLYHCHNLPHDLSGPQTGGRTSFFLQDGCMLQPSYLCLHEQTVQEVPNPAVHWQAHAREYQRHVGASGNDGAEWHGRGDVSHRRPHPILRQ
uniref:Vertebrate ancient long opsin a n=1 Tax=Esox lucius TaxID=8010 RepID=A0A3P9AC10_ESOLU